MVATGKRLNNKINGTYPVISIVGILADSCNPAENDTHFEASDQIFLDLFQECNSVEIY